MLKDNQKESFLPALVKPNKRVLQTTKQTNKISQISPQYIKANKIAPETIKEVNVDNGIMKSHNSNFPS